MRTDGRFKSIEEIAGGTADSQISTRGCKGNDAKTDNADAVTQ
jgi:hypothetical protein